MQQSRSKSCRGQELQLARPHAPSLAPWHTWTPVLPLFSSKASTFSFHHAQHAQRHYRWQSFKGGTQCSNLSIHVTYRNIFDSNAWHRHVFPHIPPRAIPFYLMPFVAPSHTFHRRFIQVQSSSQRTERKGISTTRISSPIRGAACHPGVATCNYNRGPRNVVRVYCTDRLPDCKLEVKKRKQRRSDEHAEASPHRFGAACGVGTRRVHDLMKKNAGKESRYREASRVWCGNEKRPRLD